MSYTRHMDAKKWALLHEGEESEEWYEPYDETKHGSDVYVIGTLEGNNWFLECLGCSLVDNSGKFHYHNGKKFPVVGSYQAKEQAVMITHLKKHISIGERVPQVAFDRLQQEIDEGQDWP